MTTNFEDFANLSDDELEARQRAEDGEDATTDPDSGGDEDAGGNQPQPTPTPTPSPEPTPTPTPAPAADPAGGEATAGEGGKVEGVLSKDGKRVLPYHALNAARRDARRAETRAERAEREAQELRQQIADIKAGKTPEGDMPTEEQIARMEEDFPEEGKRWRNLFNAWQKAQTAAPAKGKDPDPEPGDDPVQDAIDQVPLLLDWQHGDPEKFARAVEHDAVLVKSPKWKDKPAVERFAEATRRTAEEFDIEFPSAKSSSPEPTAAPKPAATPQPAAQAQRRTPETLSEFKGGAVPDHASLDAQNTAPTTLLNRMADWTDEQIEDYLRKHG